MKAKIIFLLTVLIIAGCGKKQIEQPPQGVQVMRVEATPGGGASGLRFSGALMPDSQVILSFRIPGYVTSIMQIRGADGRTRTIDEGDRVKKGDVLVRIRPSEYKERMVSAKSQAEAAEAIAQKAKLDYDRATRLFASQSITKSDYDTAIAQYDATQAQVRAARGQASEAEIALHDTMLIAPFSGDIVNKSVELGALVGPGAQAFAITNTDIVKIVVGVPDLTVRSLKLLQPVALTVDAFPNRTFDARITRISSAADPRTRNFDVEVSLPNSDHSLKVGMIGSLQLLGIDKGQHPSVFVPLSAIVQAPDGKYGVFLVAKSNEAQIAQLQHVEVGTVEGSNIQVTRGITAKDVVITTGATLLKDGQRVEVLQ
jgi:multidrug efflux system membrane fusion protein